MSFLCLWTNEHMVEVATAGTTTNLGQDLVHETDATSEVRR